MARRRDLSEETEVKVSEEIANEEPRRERRRRTSKIVEELDEPKTKTYTVNTDILNVRMGPGYGYQIAKQILRDDAVEIATIDNNFGEIEPGLWVDMSFLK